MSERIRVRREGRFGQITLCVQPLNILGTEDVRRLARAIRDLDACTLVLLDAEGERAFSAGMEVADHLPERAREMLAAVADMARAFQSAAPVTVAKVGASALGGGFELVLLCDFALCSHRARFSLPEIGLAALPPIACALLPRAIGERRAVDAMLTGRAIDAETAERWGIVSQAVTPEQLDDATRSLCDKLLAMSGDALRSCKRATRAANVAEAMRVYTDDLLHTEDAAEGVHAFLERRRPVWRHARSPIEVGP